MLRIILHHYLLMTANLVSSTESKHYKKFIYMMEKHPLEVFPTPKLDLPFEFLAGSIDLELFLWQLMQQQLL